MSWTPELGQAILVLEVLSLLFALSRTCKRSTDLFLDGIAIVSGGHRVLWSRAPTDLTWQSPNYELRGAFLLRPLLPTSTENRSNRIRREHAARAPRSTVPEIGSFTSRRVARLMLPRNHISVSWAGRCRAMGAKGGLWVGNGGETEREGGHDVYCILYGAVLYRVVSVGMCFALLCWALDAQYPLRL